MEISTQTDDWNSENEDFVEDVKEREEVCLVDYVRESDEVCLTPSPCFAPDLDGVVEEDCVNLPPKRVVWKESLDRLHQLCIEAMDGLEAQPEEEELMAVMFSRDGDSVVSADHILRVSMEQCGCPVEVGVIFRWMWSWPLDTPPDLLIELAQYQIRVLVADNDKRAQLIKLSLRIFGEAKTAMMQTVLRNSQGAGSDTGNNEASDDNGEFDFEFDPD